MEAVLFVIEGPFASDPLPPVPSNLPIVFRVELG